MSTVFYSCQSQRHQSVVIGYEVRADNLPAKASWLKRPKDEAAKSLRALAEASKVKWDYEPTEGILRDVTQIVDFIYKGFQAKYKAFVSSSLSNWIIDKVYRIICKLTKTPTRLERLAKLVEEVKAKTFKYSVTDRLKLHREFEEAKSLLNQAVEKTRDLFAAFEEAIQEQCKKAFEIMRAIHAKIGDLERNKQIFEKQLKESKDHFFHHEKSSNQQKLATTQQLLAEKRDEYRRLQERPRTLMSEVVAKKAEMEAACTKVEADLNAIEANLTPEAIQRVKNAAKRILEFAPQEGESSMSEGIEWLSRVLTTIL